MFFLLINDVTVNGFWVSVKFHLKISPQFCATPDAMHQAPTAHLRQVPGELLHIPPHVSAQLRHLHPVGVRVKRSKGLEALLVIYIFVFAPPDSNRLALKARVIIGGSQRLQQVLSQSMGPGDGLRKVKLDHQHDQKATNKPVLCQNWIYMHIICMYIIIHIHMHIMHIYICVCMYIVFPL